MDWLTKGLLRFPIDSRSVDFIDSPSKFYTTLLERIRRSKNRIVMSSLYLGVGELEKVIVSSIEEAKQSNPELSVSILLDFFRGTRKNLEGESSATMLNNVCKYSQVCFFHHPGMNLMFKSILPQRLNEIIGLQHMKFFIFDNSIIISGANLSEIYFTNRQDRYIIIDNCPLLVEFFVKVFETIASCSFSLGKSGEIEFLGEPELHPTNTNSNDLQKELLARFEELFKSFEEKLLACNSNKTNQSDTFVYPFLQMNPFNLNQEVDLLTRLFDNKESCNLGIEISTGYFNLYEKYANLILQQHNNLSLKIFFASPEANGFYNATGFAKNIPALYVQNSREFFDRCSISNRSDSVVLAEYSRLNWTFHAKGVWINPKDQKKKKPIIATVIGYRSAYRDLEAQILLVTEDEDLAQKIVEERQSIAKYCRTLDLSTFFARDHIVPTWVRYFSRVFRHFF